MRKLLTLSIFIFSVGLLTACGGKEKDLSDAALEDEPAQELYAQAAANMDAGNADEAALLFDSVGRLHPYSPWAVKAELMKAYGYYKEGNYDASLDAAERFIALHPGNDEVAYAWYLRALSYYMRIGDVRRDQKITLQAASALTDVISRFPDSQYARDAKIKRDLAIDHLAGHEMEVGRYYLKQGHLGAAMGRFRVVVDDYQTTTHTPEALYRLIEIYVELGMNDEARKVGAILGYNYVGSYWYNRAYKMLSDKGLQELIEQRTWVDKTADGLLGGK